MEKPKEWPVSKKGEWENKIIFGNGEGETNCERVCNPVMTDSEKLDAIFQFLKDWKYEQDYRRNSGDNRPLDEIKKLNK